MHTYTPIITFVFDMCVCVFVSFPPPVCRPCATHDFSYQLHVAVDLVPDAPGSSASTAASSTSATDKARTKAVKPLRRNMKRCNKLNGISLCTNICS